MKSTRSTGTATGIAPRVRVGHGRWFNLLCLLPIGFVALISAVAAAKGLRGIPSVQTIIDLVRPQPEAKWVVFYLLGDGPGKDIYTTPTPSSRRATTRPCSPTT